MQWRIQDLPKGGTGGADHGERAEREPKRGSGGGAPSGVPLVGGQGAKPPWSWMLFVHFYTKKWPKVEDLRENLPPCLSRAAMASSKFWPMGGGALTAHSWIRHSKVWTDTAKFTNIRMIWGLISLTYLIWQSRNLIHRVVCFSRSLTPITRNSVLVEQRSLEKRCIIVLYVLQAYNLRLNEN